MSIVGSAASLRLMMRGIAVVSAVWIGGLALGVSAAFAPTACPHNLCTEMVTVGGSSFTVTYTQHVAPGGQLRVRIDGITNSPTQLISAVIFNLPQFEAHSVTPSPLPGTVVLPEEDVSPTGFERSDSDGCPGCHVDMVMAVDFPPSIGDGVHSFDLLIIQKGESAGKNGLLFYVDGTAPTNTDESEEFNELSGGDVYVQDMDYPCADLEPPVTGEPVDNDLDYLANCADPQCTGKLGTFSASGASPPAGYCEAVETTCNDGFDNDGNGLIDCADSACAGRVGDTNGNLCELEEQICDDGFDNDGDGLLDCADNTGTVSCWKNAALGCPATETSCSDGIDNDKDQSYSIAGAWDASPLTGIDCADYDCAGAPNCPASENKDASDPPQQVDAQCFDGADNDLDQRTDCADIDDCFGAVSPTGQSCLEFEFSIAQGIQYCADDFDNDGDDLPGQPGSVTDCRDTDCRQAFGNCGPCPAREDYTYASCADAKDNDADGLMNCMDPDCLGADYPRLGSLGGQAALGSFASAAHCAAAENDNGLCSDRSDNDGNGLIDCQDPACAGHLGPDGQQCAGSENSVAWCGDGLDNDLDGLIDCADPDCFGIGVCAAKDWTNAVCRTVPEHSGLLSFTGTDPTIRVDMVLRGRAGDDHTLRLVGSASYDSVTVVVGDNTDPSQYYPYASAADCALDPDGEDPTTGIVSFNTGAFSSTVIDGHFFHLFTTGPVNGFDVTLRCPTPATPAVAADVPLSLSALKANGDAEYGDLSLFVELLEGTAPLVLEIEPEGLVGGAINIRYGETFLYRIVPSDPPGTGPPDSSGICACDIAVDGGLPISSSDGNCIITPATVYTADIPAVSVEARTEDGADNTSAPVALSFAVNVLPIVSVPTRIESPSTPFIRTGDSTVLVFAEFRTGASDKFPSGVCQVHLYDSNGNHLGGPTGSGSIINFPFNEFIATCDGAVTLAKSVTPGDGGFPADGEYFLTVRIKDNESVDGDWVESNKQPIYWCDATPSASDPESPCSKADFDRDGATEGLYTTLYADTPRACDNCLGMGNSDQLDTNANGIGDMCESGKIGRCEIDRDLVCDCGALPDYTPPNKTPGAEPEREETDPPSGLDETTFVNGTCQLYCPDPSIATDPAATPGSILHDDEGHKLEQRCVVNWGICLVNGEFCISDNECQSSSTQGCTGGEGITDEFEACSVSDPSTCESGQCVSGFGTCADDGAVLCRRDSDCHNQNREGPCLNADICTDLLSPWLETKHGNVYSGYKIDAPEEPPNDNVNATFCITAKDTIRNFKSGSTECPTEQNSSLDYTLPTAANDFRTVLGSIDVEGLLAGKYGQVQSLYASGIDSTTLAGKVYVYDAAEHGGDPLVIGDPALGADANPGVPLTFNNGFGSGSGLVKGSGTIVVKGGDLIINRDIAYSVATVTDLRYLASVAFIVLADDTGAKGNIYIHRRVSNLAGVFYADGEDPGIQMHGKDQFSSNVQLTVHGLMIARKFIFSREFRSLDQGSERILYDGRAVVNPPPGFADVSKLLPQFMQASF